MNNKLPLDAYKEAFLIVSTGKDSSGAAYNTLGTLNQAAWLGERAGVMIAEIERLQAQVEELQKDKARLDWLAGKIVCHGDTRTSDNWCWYGSPVTEDNNLVEAIDKAMEQAK